MDNKKQVEILKKWFAKQMIKRVFFMDVKEVSIDDKGNEVVNIVKKKKVMVVAPSTKVDNNRIHYLVLPDGKTISYTEPKVRNYNSFTQSFVVNNTTKKASEIKDILFTKVYAHYGLDYEKVKHDNY